MRHTSYIIDRFTLARLLENCTSTRSNTVRDQRTIRTLCLSITAQTLSTELPIVADDRPRPSYPSSDDHPLQLLHRQLRDRPSLCSTLTNGSYGSVVLFQLGTYRYSYRRQVRSNITSGQSRLKHGWSLLETKITPNPKDEQRALRTPVSSPRKAHSQ